MPNDTFTYVSSNNICSTSWLDHVISSDFDIISNIHVLYGDSFSDHIPLKFDFKLPSEVIESRKSQIDHNFQRPHIVAWSQVTDDDILEYSEALDFLTQDLLNDAIICNNQFCNNNEHLNYIDEFFSMLGQCILEASEGYLPTISKKGTFRAIPGWNDHCKESYRIARDHFLLWRSIGKPRSGVIFAAMKDAKAVFRRALNFCKNNERNLRKSKLVNSFQHRNKSCFWKNVRQLSPKTISQSIDKTNDPVEINNIFTNKYRSILQDDSCSSNYNMPHPGDAGGHCCNIMFQPFYIDEAINKLNSGLGFDMIHANHFKYSSDGFRRIFGRFLSACMKHSHVPEDMIAGVVKPVLKGSTCKSKSENYRPVMNSCISMKILEYALLPTLKAHLKINPLQFGFQPDSSCDLAVALVKETINFYKSMSTNIHSAAIDLSKAYDKVNHDKLINKLIDAKVPYPITKLLQSIYSRTHVSVRFDCSLGTPFKVCNGLRQGGCTSSLLFAFYINETLNEIRSLDIGCRMNGENLNIVAYADDVILLSPSLKGLQDLINRISLLFTDLCLKINVDKSKYIMFKHRKTNSDALSCTVLLNGSPLERIKELKYLGVILTENLDLSADTDRILKSFLAQFNGVYQKFHFLPRYLLSFLFKTYATSFYGLNIWFEEIIKNKDVRKVEVAYHKAVKKIAGLNVWNSNHLACELVGVNIFRHLLSRRLLNFYFSAINTKCRMINNLKYHFMLTSKLYSTLKLYFRSLYDVDCLLGNDRSALIARIYFVERNEPRSNHVYEP